MRRTKVRSGVKVKSVMKLTPLVRLVRPPFVLSFKPKIFGLAILLAAGSDFALAEECYKLVHGKGNPICRKLGENLNRFCDQPPMRRELAIHPDFAKDFAFPKWEDLDPQANIELVAEAHRSWAVVAHDCKAKCDTGERERQWQLVRAQFLEAARRGCLRFSRARVDINHDGKKELVFRLVGNCPSQNTNDAVLSYSDGLSRLMVLDEITEKFDRGFAFERSWLLSDVILHQGRASITKYESVQDTWRVMKSASSQGIPIVIFPDPVCEYRILKGSASFDFPEAR